MYFVCWRDTGAAFADKELISAATPKVSAVNLPIIPSIV
jgi:hypothetical protein